MQNEKISQSIATPVDCCCQVAIFVVCAASACNFKPSALITLRMVSNPGLLSPESALYRLSRDKPASPCHLCHTFCLCDVPQCLCNKRCITICLFNAHFQISGLFSGVRSCSDTSYFVITVFDIFHSYKFLHPQDSP